MIKEQCKHLGILLLGVALGVLMTMVYQQRMRANEVLRKMQFPKSEIKIETIRLSN